MNARKPSNYPYKPITLGDHLRKRRLDNGLLIKQAAEILGVQAESVSHWENNHMSPALRFIPRIIRFLGYIPYDMRDKSIGEKILICRNVLGETHEDIAKRIGVTASTVLKWENNRGVPSSRYLDALDKFFASIIDSTMSLNTNLTTPVQHRTD